MFHPHIHCEVPDGGLGTDNSKWIKSKKKFFIPVEVLSRKFRGKYLFYLNNLYKNNKINFPKSISELHFKKLFDEFKYIIYKKE